MYVYNPLFERAYICTIHKPLFEYQPLFETRIFDLLAGVPVLHADCSMLHIVVASAFSHANRGITAHDRAFRILESILYWYFSTDLFELWYVG